MDILVFGGIAWLIGAIAVGVVAEFRGRAAPPWFLISVVLSPLFGAVLLIAMPSKAKLPRDESGALITTATHRRCDDCREVIRKDARKCKHCGATTVPT